MVRDIPSLQQMASDYFSEELAEAVRKQIDNDAKQHSEPLGNFDDALIGKKSAATLYLGDRFYSKLNTGQFAGVPAVHWNGLDPRGEPTFVYVPETDNPFKYITHDGREIIPKTMDTDGGSIPRILHGLGKFSPWIYAPAYLIHDWIFVAYKTGTSPDNNIAFEESAKILAEAIKTLMVSGFQNFDGENQAFEKAEDSLYLIYTAVNSFVAKNIWTDTTPIRQRH